MAWRWAVHGVVAPLWGSPPPSLCSSTRSLTSSAIWVCLTYRTACCVAVAAERVRSGAGILIKSGASKWQALGINSLSACFATAGAAAGVYLEQSPVFADYVLPVTAGGFIYVAMAEMIPQLQEAPSVLHSVGIALGVFLMACVSLLE